jgi:hypothetical protein
MDIVLFSDYSNHIIGSLVELWGWISTILDWNKLRGDGKWGYNVML